MARQSIYLLGFTDKTCVAKPTYKNLKLYGKAKQIRCNPCGSNTRFLRPNRDMGGEFPPRGEFPPPSSIQYFGGGDFPTPFLNRSL